MANKTLTPQEYQALQNANVGDFPIKARAIDTFRKTAPVKIKSATISVIDSLSYLLFVFLFFFFTGCAILLGKPLPKEWMKLLKSYELKRLMERLTRKTPEKQAVGDLVQATKTPTKVRVVDLETGTTIPQS